MKSVNAKPKYGLTVKTLLALEGVDFVQKNIGGSPRYEFFGMVLKYIEVERRGVLFVVHN